MHAFGFNDCKYWKRTMAEPFQDTSEVTGFHNIMKEIKELMSIFFNGKTSAKLPVCVFSHKVLKKSKYKTISIFVDWQHCNGSTVPFSTEDCSSWAKTGWVKSRMLQERNWKFYRTGRLISSWSNSFSP